MGRNQYWAERVYGLCVYYMTGTPEGSTESGFMEKPVVGTPTFEKIQSVSFKLSPIIYYDLIFRHYYKSGYFETN